MESNQHLLTDYNPNLEASFYPHFVHNKFTGRYLLFSGHPVGAGEQFMGVTYKARNHLIFTISKPSAIQNLSAITESTPQAMGHRIVWLGKVKTYPGSTFNQVRIYIPAAVWDSRTFGPDKIASLKGYTLVPANSPCTLLVLSLRSATFKPTSGPANNQSSDHHQEAQDHDLDDSSGS